MSQVPELAFESTSTLTQPEFAAWVADRPSSDLNHYELLDGKVVMTPPAGYPHGRIAPRISSLIARFVDEHALGVCDGSNQGFELPTGDTVEPDFSFTSNERWQAAPTPQPGKFLRLVPDLIVEILSPSTERKDRTVKKRIYDRNGVREYWLVDTEARELVVFCRAGDTFDEPRIFPAGTVFQSRVLAGLEVDVATLLP